MCKWQLFLIIPILILLQSVSSANSYLDRRLPTSKNELHTLEKRVQNTINDVKGSVVGIRHNSSQGSGVIISKDGYVATAAHVIATEERAINNYHIYLPDGTRVPAELLGYYEDGDYGLLKFDPEGLSFQPAKLGNTYSVGRGQWVISFGHPLGMEHNPSFEPPSSRLGRISSIQRDSRLWRLTMDAPLISGDSGGPVFAVDGKLIGLNISISIRSPQINHFTAITPLVEHLKVLKNNRGLLQNLQQTLENRYTDLTSEGIKHLRERNFNLAVKNFRETIRLSPSRPIGHYNLACAYALLSQIDNALENRAIEALRLAVDRFRYNQSRLIELLTTDNDLDSLRGSFEFRSILSRAQKHQTYLGVSFESSKNLTITSIGDHTAADYYELPLGGKVTHINNLPVNNLQELAKIVLKLEPADIVNFEISGESYKIMLGGRPEYHYHRVSRNHREFLRILGLDFSDSFVRVRSNGNRIGLGIFIDKDSVMVKRSDFLSTESVQFYYRGEEVRDFNIEYHNPTYDILVIELPVDGEPVSFDNQNNNSQGSFVFSYSSRAIGFGSKTLEVLYQRPYIADDNLGLSFNRVENTFNYRHDNLYKITNIIKHSWADYRSLEIGDILLEVDGRNFEKLTKLEHYLMDKEVDDLIMIKFARKVGGNYLYQRIFGQIQPWNTESRPHQNPFVGPYSQRHDHFGTVLPHDTIILPNQTMSLLVNSHGEIIGLNIARYDRVRTLALPAQTVVREIINKFETTYDEEIYYRKH